ncbi:hypothetical protein [Burkholderia pyrrocinia]|nr:hypothetical protein [Burkholderia pyrrocinia]
MNQVAREFDDLDRLAHVENEIRPQWSVLDAGIVAAAFYCR